MSSVAFSPDGRTLASASRDGSIILWDVASRMPLGELVAGPHREILDIAYSADGQLIASGHRDASVMLWTVGLKSLLSRACRIAGRDLDASEWERYLGELPREPTCPQFAARL